MGERERERRERAVPEVFEVTWYSAVSLEFLDKMREGEGC